jgi:bacterial/archaeal transporter family protein
VAKAVSSVRGVSGPTRGRPAFRGCKGHANREIIMWIVYALLSALAGAAMATLTKAALRGVDPDVGLAVQSVVILAVAWGNVAMQGDLGRVRDLDGRAWSYLLVAGVVTAGSSLLLFRALKLAEASRVVPLDRLSLVFAMVLGAAFLKEKITWQVAVGGALMAAGALVIATERR